MFLATRLPQPTPLLPATASSDQVVAPAPITIVTEQLRQQDPGPRNLGAPMCSKLIAEIKTAETTV